MNTEGGRIANLLSNSRCSMAAEALAKARSLNKKGCGCAPPSQAVQTKTESALLASQNCFFHQGPESGVPESVRIARMAQRTIDLSFDPKDPLARFSQFRRPFIEICPPIPTWYYHAGEPILQGKNCALPNKSDNPVLPG